METRDIVFSIVMVVSAFVLTYVWLGRFKYSPANSLIVLAAIVMVGALAAMLLSLDMRMRKIEEQLDLRERSLRINIQSVEDNMGKKIDTVTNVVDDAMETFNRRNYR
ncbi:MULTISPECIES: hypothetical protein [Methanohalophilus]|jgi:hypothetical protein|uniref:Uncharacterized protein n=3 Tax=Methanohalophilus TaxID=2175 RepID=D5E854_METMS|nr:MULTISPECIES: hypothetical protein [Methanohalophilus]KXS45265.1 MAG: hypothetical protein AWU58_1071 [Methanohalophilus sp. T328-1]RSD36341.1 MAG: hypothetical protein CI952_236 [Methanohalophilus sp.]ADE37342.1 hypothetical protein Mmah_1847 [Methanohalophilus mahii DSM 5219]APH38805.1 hypothetical protein BHR79_04415 [Methanohalophilus halophilus]OBZ34532.1 MAG: hypothetical protein A9957_02335 [Methanohalophilus sp. DAL1]